MVDDFEYIVEVRPHPPQKVKFSTLEREFEQLGLSGIMLYGTLEQLIYEGHVILVPENAPDPGTHAEQIARYWKNSDLGDEKQIVLAV